jgi:DNA-binding PadR family transcriptional regulator
VSISSRVNSRLSPEYVLLGFLFSSPDHGYDLHKRMETEFENIWHGSQSQTYNILKRLETQGYIIQTEIKQEKLPLKQLLRITETGVQRFESWLYSPTKPSVHAIRVEFISRLYFMQLYYPQKVAQMIEIQSDVVDEGLRRLEDNLRNLPVNQQINQLALQLRINLLRSVNEWLQECGEAFTK